MKAIVHPAIVLLVALAHITSASTQKDRQDLLDCHNYRRSQLALGKVAGQPEAADMTLMDYDLAIEERAQSWSSTCASGHDSNDDRLVSDYQTLTYIGQNAAWNSGGNVIESGCNGWWDEYKDYSYQSNSEKPGSEGKAIGHYTQMAWAESTVLGCGVTLNCNSGFKMNAFCNFAPGGNWQGVAPYKAGKACSECPDGYNMCMENSLCARIDQCENSKAKCECALKRCENGGTLQVGSCSCSCENGFYGDRCQNVCEDTEAWCSYPSMQCDNSYYLKVCKKACNQCVNIKPFITSNSGGVISRIKQDSFESTNGNNNDGGDDGDKNCNVFCFNNKTKYCEGESYVVKNNGYKFKCTCGITQCVYIGT